MPVIPEKLLFLLKETLLPDPATEVDKGMLRERSAAMEFLVVVLAAVEGVVVDTLEACGVVVSCLTGMSSDSTINEEECVLSIDAVSLEPDLFFWSRLAAG